MSAYLYGRVRRAQAAGGAVPLAGQDNKLIEGLVALIPADILALHALVLAATTKTVPGDGSPASPAAVQVIGRSALQWSLPTLAGLAVALFVLGHLKASETPAFKWETLDFLRMFLPALAFMAWALLTGTSAATPWVERLSKGYITLIGGTVAVLVLALATSLAGN